MPKNNATKLKFEVTNPGMQKTIATAFMKVSLLKKNNYLPKLQDKSLVQLYHYYVDAAFKAKLPSRNSDDFKSLIKDMVESVRNHDLESQLTDVGEKLAKANTLREPGISSTFVSQEAQQECAKEIETNVNEQLNRIIEEGFYKKEKGNIGKQVFDDMAVALQTVSRSLMDELTYLADNSPSTRVDIKTRMVKVFAETFKLLNLKDPFVDKYKASQKEMLTSDKNKQLNILTNFIASYSSELSKLDQTYTQEISKTLVM